MEVIVKTTYDGKEQKECVDGVLSVQNAGNGVVAIVKSDTTQYIGLDGYTEIIVR